MFCLGCDYQLDHLSSRRCPECGREFDPADPSTFTTHAWSVRTRGHEPLIFGAIGALVGVMVGFSMGSLVIGVVVAIIGLMLGFLAGYGTRGRGRGPRE